MVLDMKVSYAVLGLHFYPIAYSLRHHQPLPQLRFSSCAAVEHDKLGVHRSLGCVHGNVGPPGVVRVFDTAAVLPLLIRFRAAVFGANFHRRSEFSVGIRLCHRLRGAGEMHACPYGDLLCQLMVSL